MDTGGAWNTARYNPTDRNGRRDVLGSHQSVGALSIPPARVFDVSVSWSGRRPHLRRYYRQVKNIDTSDESNDTTNRAESTVYARPSGSGGAASFVLTTEDLAELGFTVNPGDTIVYGVDDGDFYVETVGGSDE